MKENKCPPGHLVGVCGVRGRDGAECLGSYPPVCTAPHQPCVVWTPTLPLTVCLQVSLSSSLKMGITAPTSMTTWQVYMRLGCKNVSIPSLSFNIQKIRRLSLVCMKSSLGSQNPVQYLRQTLKSRPKFSTGWSMNPPGPRRDSPCPVLTSMSAEQQSPRHSHRFPAHHGCPCEETRSDSCKSKQLSVPSTESPEGVPEPLRARSPLKLRTARKNAGQGQRPAWCHVTAQGRGTLGCTPARELRSHSALAAATRKALSSLQGHLPACPKGVWGPHVAFQGKGHVCPQ